ncbi:MAG: arginine deiminase family protein, partial [Myxococcota bacterium]
YAGVVAEHDRYLEALAQAGVGQILTLPPLEDFPDAVFIEDPALVFSEGAILLRPGAESRRDEAKALAPDLPAHFPRVLELPEGGHVEGGDVLVTPSRVFIGLSARTDERGARHLAEALGALGKQAFVTQTPKGILHFKTACSLLDEETVLVTERMAASGVFEGFRTLVTPPGEAAAANALRVNETVLVGAQFPATQDLLGHHGYRVEAVPTEQIGRLDAGLSCLSLRWSRP